MTESSMTAVVDLFDNKQVSRAALLNISGMKKLESRLLQFSTLRLSPSTF